jgi:transcriptional regulator with XRE-family HTH domain
MDRATRERLERAGFRVGGAEDFLDLSAEERELVELRLRVSHTVRRLRERVGFTQKQLASRIDSSQSRVAKIEASAADVSLDLLFRALFAVGGHIDDLKTTDNPRKRARSATRQKAQRKHKAAAQGAKATHKEDPVETGERHG